MYRLEQEESNVSDKQSSIENRYYNNQNFQNEYSINNRDVNIAATKIQAQFRGHKTRRDLEKKKGENKQIIDSDHEHSTIINDELSEQYYDEEENKNNNSIDEHEEFNEEEKREQERAAISIQAGFRGFQVRKNLQKSSGDLHEQQQQKLDNYDKTSTHSSDRFHLNENLTAHDEIEPSKTNTTNRSLLERDPRQLSEDFEKYTNISRDSNFTREQHTESFTDEDNMTDTNLDKAATRIQASYRGYKTRKELSSISGHSNTGQDHQHPSSPSSPTHNEHDNARNKNILSPSAQGNKVPANENDDNAAAVKIQAAYRGYRVRKDLDK